MFLTRNVTAEIFSILIAIANSASDNDYYDKDIRAGLARVEIGAPRLIEREESSLILAKTDGRRRNRFGFGGTDENWRKKALHESPSAGKCMLVRA
jgi:hypothetical protein